MTRSATSLPDVCFRIGEGYALYEGPSGDNTRHAHAAFQIAIALRGEVAIEDGAGLQKAAVLVVPPMVQHRLTPTSGLRNFYIEPHCGFADELRRACGIGVTALPAMHGLHEDTVRSLCAGASEQLDPRLQTVMAALARRAGGSLPALARSAGLSEQRLRALAHRQLGMPLARWRVWLRFRLAARAVGTGHGLAAAAQIAGFADQAHLSRQMREMFGISPATLLPLLRAQGRDAT